MAHVALAYIVTCDSECVLHQENLNFAHSERRATLATIKSDQIMRLEIHLYLDQAFHHRQLEVPLLVGFHLLFHF